MKAASISWVLLLLCGVSNCRRDSPTRSTAAPAVAEAAPAVALAEDPRVARFRADMQRVEPAAPPQRIEEEVAKFAANLARAGTQPYPASHASCLKETSGRPAYDCTLVAGDVIRPTWFEACKRAGGAVLTSNVPPNTPLHYDGEFCTKTFRVGE